VTLFEQIKSLVVSPLLDRFFLNLFSSSAERFVNLANEAAESGETRGIGDPRTTEEHHVSFLMETHEVIRDIGSICDENRH
jgi:hypothetical protein